MNWHWVTNEMMDRELVELVGDMPPTEILSHGEVQAYLREHFNNELLSRLADKHGKDRTTGEDLEEDEEA